MIGDFTGSIGWYSRIASGFLLAQPWRTLVAISSELLSRISLTVAFVLPVKVIILLGSPRVPDYFPSLIREMGRDNLIIALAGTAACFYLIHLITGRFSQQQVERLAKVHHRSTDKIAVLPNQPQAAQSAYALCLYSMTGIAFILIAGLCIGLFYPKLLWVVAGFMGLAGLATLLVVALFPSATHALTEKQAGFFGVLSAMGFLVALAFIVVDFLSTTNPPPLIYALFAFVLTRQMLNSSAVTGIQLSSLIQQRIRVDALFFDGRFVAHGEIRSDVSFWSKLDPRVREAWLAELLRGATGVPPDSVASTWFQTTTKGSACFWLAASSRSNQAPSSFFLKIFSARRLTLASKEEAILREGNVSELSLPLIEIGEAEAGRFHLFDATSAIELPASQRGSAMLKLNARLLAHEPPKAFTRRYERTHLQLWERIDRELFARLRVAADRQDRAMLDSLVSRLDELLEDIRGLPLQIVMPRISVRDLVVVNEDVKVVNWTNWVIEPIGVGWAFRTSQDLTELKQTLKEAARTRRNLADIPIQKVCTAAQLADIERCHDAQDYTAAIKVTRDLLSGLSAPDLCEEDELPERTHQTIDKGAWKRSTQ